MHRDKSRLRQSRPPNLLRSLRNLGSNISIETLAACISPKSRKNGQLRFLFHRVCFDVVTPPSPTFYQEFVPPRVVDAPVVFPFSSSPPLSKNDCRGGLFVTRVTTRGEYEYRRERSCMDTASSEIRNLSKVVRIRSRMEDLEFVLS